jgi:hypothetical protein
VVVLAVQIAGAVIAFAMALWPEKSPPPPPQTDTGTAAEVELVGAP